MTAAAPEPTGGSSGWTVPPTEAGPAPGLRYAGFWVRLVAFILDAIVLAVLIGALAPLFGLGGMVMNEGSETRVNYGGSGLYLLIDLVYFVGFWAWRGQTPGMMPFNMRVVEVADGGRVDPVRALLRYVGLIISIAIFLLGVIWIGFDRRKQGWHDKIAATVVVRPT